MNDVRPVLAAAAFLALCHPLFAQAPADTLTSSLQTALDLHRNGDTAGALTRILAAEEEARARLPLLLRNAQVLDGYPENLGMYRAAPGSMVFNDTAIFYVEVENHGLRRRGDAHEVDTWTDLFILDEDGTRIGGKEKFGEHKFTARHPHRVTHMVMEAAMRGLPPGKYLAQVVVHDAVSGKQGEVRIPFRVAARPAARP